MSENIFFISKNSVDKSKWVKVHTFLIFCHDYIVRMPKSPNWLTLNYCLNKRDRLQQNNFVDIIVSIVHRNIIFVFMLVIRYYILIILDKCFYNLCSLNFFLSLINCNLTSCFNLNNTSGTFLHQCTSNIVNCISPNCFILLHNINNFTFNFTKRLQLNLFLLLFLNNFSSLSNNCLLFRHQFFDTILLFNNISYFLYPIFNLSFFINFFLSFKHFIVTCRLILISLLCFRVHNTCYFTTIWFNQKINWIYSSCLESHRWHLYITKTFRYSWLCFETRQLT